MSRSTRLSLAAAAALFASLVLGVSLAAGLAPIATIEPASEVGAFSAHVEGEVDPQDKATSYRFEQISDARFQENLASSLPGFQGATQFGHGGPLAAGSGQQTVEATAKLEPNTTYHLRLVASSEDGAAEAVAPNFTTDAIAPTLSKSRHAQLGGGEVAVAGFLNPRNAEVTDCHFEYGPTAGYGQSIACESLPPTDNQPHLVRAELTDLTLGATYHFRLSATTSSGTTEGDDATFIPRNPSIPDCPDPGALGASFLPDCRAWELVSPPDRHAGDVNSAFTLTYAADEGGAVSFNSLTGFGDVGGMSASAEYLSRRSGEPGTNGWTTHALNPPQEAVGFFGNSNGAASGFIGYSGDLSSAVFQAWTPLTADPFVANLVNLYRRDDVRQPGPGSYELITACLICAKAFPLAQKIGGTPRIGGSSADLTHVLFHSSLNLAAGASGSQTKLYEWDNGTLRLGGVLPSAAAAATSVAGKGYNPTIPNPPAISADGSRIFFTVGSDGGKEEFSGVLYVRIAGRSTVQLNASERTVPDATGPATYRGASADGTRVFFTSDQALTDDAQGTQAKLYMWKQASTDETQQVTVDAGSGSFILSFNGKATAPIAFDASAAVVDAALEQLVTVKPGNVTVSGGPGSAGGATPYEITFSGDFGGANVAQILANGAGLSGGTATVATTEPVENLTQIDVDSEPADGIGGTVQGVIGLGDSGEDVYFAAGGQRVAGAPLLQGGGVVGFYHWHEGDVDFIGSAPAFSSAAPEILPQLSMGLRPLQTDVTPDGRDLLFTSKDGEGLLSASGGTDYDHGKCIGSAAGCPVLYHYSADRKELQCVSCKADGSPPEDEARARFSPPSVGAGGPSVHLTNPLSDDGRFAFFSTAEPLLPEDVNDRVDAYRFDSQSGEIKLLSTGISPVDSYFLDASASGGDAFFTTRERLSAWDRNDEYDLYDAHIGGGFPEPPPVPAPCAGDLCQGTQGAAPADADPASANLRAAGNRKPSRQVRRCGPKRRKIRRNGRTRCVKRKTRKKRQGRQHRAADANRRASR